jgi:hypothetical protein
MRRQNRPSGHLVRVLTINSAKDLIKYRSFFLLIFILIAFDRAVHHWLPVRKPDFKLPDLRIIGEQTAIYIFESLPGQLLNWLTDNRAIGIIAALFLLKQIISLWPSSDMRRMHRKERKRFGILAALAAIRWQQVLWDAVAVSTVCGVVGLWTLLVFSITRIGWQYSHDPFWLILLSGLVSLSLPIGMAGFSYSSKLAVLSRGRFMEKLVLFFMLFTDWRILWTSWVFFLARIVVEAMFVEAIPVSAIVFIDHFWVRMPIAAVSATPVYAYLKMASFKFFLFTYNRFQLVREEYQEYYKNDLRT